MSNQSAYRSYTITLLPGQVFRISSYGSFLIILDNDIGTDPRMSINGDAFEEIPAGISVQLPPQEKFQYLLLQNPDGADTMTLRFALSASLIQDNRLVISGSVFTDILAQFNGDLTPENWGDDIAVGAAAVQLLAANANRKSLLVQSDIANPGIIYIGYDNTVGSTKKVATLLPGGAFSVDDYRGAIWAISGVPGNAVSASEV